MGRLAPNTQYFFTIYPYTNAGATIDYKTDGNPPTNNATTNSYSGPNAWINEFHYTNAGSDAGEFIEVVIENPGSYDLTKFKVNAYNGSNSTSYSSKVLSDFTVGNNIGNFTIYYYYWSGIQNGNPDGLALSYDGVLITGQFLSYGGSFTASGGPADGVTSTDIGVSESGTTPVGQSLQLKGGGNSYDKFFWAEPATETPGTVNNFQFFGNYTTWIGSTDNDWATASNWINGVPDATLSVVVPQDLTNYPTLGAEGSCLDFYMESNASLVGVDNLTVSGTATVEQTINGYTSSADGFHFLSSPVASFAIAGSDFVPVDGTDDFYSWDEPTNSWSNWFDGMDKPEILKLEMDTWLPTHLQTMLPLQEA